MPPIRQGLHIRPADLHDMADQNAIVALLDMYARDAMGQEMPLPNHVRDEIVPGLRNHPHAYVCLAFDSGRAVGVAVCFEGFSTFRAKPLMNIHDLAVSPEVRGQGVGRRLLEAVEREANRRNCCKVTLEVRSDNLAAKGLYRNCGFHGGPPDSAYAFWTKSLAEDA